MRVVREIKTLQAELTGAGRVGLVPTMGAFHDGHLSLIREARATCDQVVVWLFVNPTQFNDPADLTRYPRDEERDAVLAEACGADLLFVPQVEEIYPKGFATTVYVSGLGDVFEGAQRPGHFAGVATVVAKMLNIVHPDVAFFGSKDAQQVAIVRRLIADLHIPVRIEVLPTVREADGLAMSSRNIRLDPRERKRATALYHGLCAAHAALSRGRQDAAGLVRMVEEVLVQANVTVDYVAVVDRDTFEPVARVERPALIAVAAWVGSIRLIDNLEVNP